MSNIINNQWKIKLKLKKKTIKYFFIPSFIIYTIMSWYTNYSTYRKYLNKTC